MEDRSVEVAVDGLHRNPPLPALESLNAHRNMQLTPGEIDKLKAIVGTSHFGWEFSMAGEENEGDHGEETRETYLP